MSKRKSDTSKAKTPAVITAPEPIGTPGRPTVYTDELGRRICDALADGRTLNHICRSHEDFPEPRTVRRWAADPEHPFSPLYARAREVGYLYMADDLIDVADDGRNDTYKTDEGTELVNHDVIARAKLRVDTRKWIISKALPKIYGDKVAITDAEGGPVQVKFVR